MAATNYPSFLNPYGFSTQYQLRFGVVVGHDPERHAVHVSFRDTMEYVGYSLPVLNSWADGYYVEQKPLPKKGTLVLCAFPMGDDRNGVVIGALYGSNLSAITQESSGYNPYTDYVRYPNNIWKMADSQANITWVHPSGMYFNINTGGTSQLQPTYNVVSSENPNLTETQSVPSVPQTAPPYFYFSHPSGASFEIDPSGDLTTNVPGTFNETVDGDITQTYKGSLTTQVTNDVTLSSGSQLTTQVGSTETTLTSSSSSTSAGGVTQTVSSSGISGSSGGSTFMDVTAAGVMTLLGAVAATGFTIGGNSVVTSFNGSYGAIVADLNTLSGVSISNPTNGQVLEYNGTDWVNASIVSGVSSVFGRTGAITAEAGDYSSYYGGLSSNNTWTGTNTFNNTVNFNTTQDTNYEMFFGIAKNSAANIVFNGNSSATYPDNIAWARSNAAGYAFFVYNNTSNQNLFQITDAGNAYLLGTLSQGSSINVKSNINNLTYYDCYNLLNLNPVRYEYKHSHTPSFGFISESVKDIYPELVETSKDNLPLNYIGLIAPIVGLLKSLHGRLSAIESKLEDRK